jgi:hypothetical protein
MGKRETRQGSSSSIKSITMATLHILRGISEDVFAAVGILDSYSLSALIYDPHGPMEGKNLDLVKY